MTPALSPSEFQRYSRHILLPEIGESGQKKLKGARVLVAGAGGLGCPVALYLAGAGVGMLGIADFDIVELSNLQRQVLFATEEVAQGKAELAKNRLQGLNDSIEITAYHEALTSSNVMQVLSDYDLLVDGTDNFAARYLLNDACMLQRKPYVYGAIHRFEGQVSVFTNTTGCYRCLFPEPPPPEAIPNCAEAGVLGVLPGTIGILQATEALKLILGIGESLAGRLLCYDALSMRVRELQYSRNSECRLCGDRPTIHAVKDEQAACDVPAQVITPGELESRLSEADLGIALIDVRTQEEFAQSRIAYATCLPLPELPARLGELDRSREVVVYCQSGRRSQAAVEILRANGYTARSLQGGIDAWKRLTQ